MLEPAWRLGLGLLTGIAFGFLLQKGRVAKHSVIVGQLVLRDFTVSKIMLTAIAVGAIGFWALAAVGATPVDVKPAQMGGVLSGAVLFGLGLAVLGYCPGTTVAAVGEGRRDAVAGLVGMITGALTFVLAFATFGGIQETVVDWGKLTLPDATHVAPTVYVIALALIGAVTYFASRAWRARRAH